MPDTFTRNMDHWYPKGTMEEPYLPIEMYDLDLVFPAGMDRLMPPQEKIPDAFKKHSGTRWNELQARWFFSGLPEGTKWVPNKGINKDADFRHLKAIQSSWDPKHEYKEAAVAYLMSLWFKKVDAPKE